MQDIEEQYQQLGGRFITSIDGIKNRLLKAKAFIFDWDGVFNDGSKTANASSAFSEVDSMGTNLLRYSHFLRHKNIPITAVISGEKNDTAFYFSKRECFHYNFYKAATNKIDALHYICNKEKIKPEQVVYFFDDVLDLSIAEICGLRILVNQKSNPLFANYCKHHHLADYITANRGGDFAVREVTELLIGLNDNFEQVISDRKSAGKEYQHYLEHRRAVNTQFFTFADNMVIAGDVKL